jgi:hypothetical protein
MRRASAIRLLNTSSLKGFFFLGIYAAVNGTPALMRALRTRSLRDCARTRIRALGLRDPNPGRDPRLEVFIAKSISYLHET